MATIEAGIPGAQLYFEPERSNLIGSELPATVADGVVMPEQAEDLSGSELFERYLRLRDQALSSPKIEGGRLARIKRRVGRFIEKYGLLEGPYDEYSEEALSTRWGAISDYLKKIAPDIDASEHEATDMYRRAAFKMWEETPPRGQKHPDGDASFAFAVPPRNDRKHPEYGYEVESVLPLLRYVPEKMRGRAVKGLPPSIIDVYKRSSDGKRGYLVFTPVFGDEAIDIARATRPWRLAAELIKSRRLPTVANMRKLGGLMLSAFIQRANARIVDTTNFAARRLGADVIGLGAVLPGLTNFGRNLEVENTTTGHGGTVRLILDTLRAVKDQRIGRAAVAEKIGVLGLGSIGFSIADVVGQVQLRGEGGANRKLIIYDKDSKKIERVQRHLAELGLDEAVEVAEGVAELLEESDVVISAITERLNLGKLRYRGRRGKPNLADLVIIDDGQPGSVIRSDAEKHGVKLVWVLGRAYNGTEELVRSNFRFGVNIEDVFGCEAEVASIAARLREMRKAGASEEEVANAVRHFAIRGPVKPELVWRISELFANKIGPAPLQSYGQLLEAPNGKSYKSSRYHRRYEGRHRMEKDRKVQRPLVKT